MALHAPNADDVARTLQCIVVTRLAILSHPTKEYAHVGFGLRPTSQITCLVLSNPNP